MTTKLEKFEEEQRKKEEEKNSLFGRLKSAYDSKPLFSDDNKERNADFAERAQRKKKMKDGGIAKKKCGSYDKLKKFLKKDK